MKLGELFNVTKIQDDSKSLDNGSIFEGSLNDMVEDHLPENTRAWRIQWVMSEDGNDAYRPQFIFARTKQEAAKKFTERMRHPKLGLVAIESIIEIRFDQINEGDVIRPFPDKVLWSKKMRDFQKTVAKSDQEKYDDAVTKQSGPSGYDDFGDGTGEEVGRTELGKKKWSDWFAGDLPVDEGDVIDFPGKVVIPINKNMSDQEKYDMALSNQKADQEGGGWDPVRDDVHINADPNREDMHFIMTQLFSAPGLGEDDYEAAMYWFATDFNKGEGSNLDKVLSGSQYNPGPMASKIEDENELAQELYFSLYDYFSTHDAGGYPNEGLTEDDHRWAKSHGKRGRSEEDKEFAMNFLRDVMDDVKQSVDDGISHKQIAINFEVEEDDIDDIVYSDQFAELYYDEEGEPVDEVWESKKKKKRKKKATVKNNFGIKPAEKSTKYDPPKTNYGKNVSARRGFVG